MTGALQTPDVDYLTRDYEGFRQLLLSLIDRSETRWTERSAADTGVMLVEILAQQLDLMAYAGDRVAEEAFLGTARQRESARRHASLGDYRLDQGNATSGHQHFRLRKDRQAPLLLRAGAQVGQRLMPGQDPARRLIAETTEDAELDARRNELSLARSAAAGGTVLHLAAEDGARLDLRAIGLRPGMRLCLVGRDGGEVVTLRGVQGGAVELAAPLERTYLSGGADAPRVLGNLVPIRHGATLAWRLVGHGGASMDEGPGDFIRLRLDTVRRLRDEAEAARAAWVGDGDLSTCWHLANAAAGGVARKLRERAGAALGPQEAAGLEEDLQRAAQHFRVILEATGRAVPPPLRPTRRAPLPKQGIPLRGDLPQLWHEGSTTLEVLAGGAGRWDAWTKVEDFLRSGPADRHYVAESDAAGEVTLRFGDGVNGAVLPPDCQVMVRRVTGDPALGDLGARALDVLVGSGDPESPIDLEAFDARTPTFNPLPTGGGRPLEDLDDLPQRLRRKLQSRVVPVTVPDHVELVLGRPDRPDLPRIAEAGAALARGRVEVVLRPAPGTNAAAALAKIRALLREDRLAGTDVWVRLAEPLHVALEILVDVHPEVTPADLRLRLRRKLLELFGDAGEELLGRPRTRAEVYASVEGVPGVIYSEVIGFDLASRQEGAPVAQEAIVPASHQVVRCLDLPDNPSAGSIRIWTARRFHLLVDASFADPDDAYDEERLRAVIEHRLSGRHAVPVRERWEEITPARIDDLLRRITPPGARYRLSVRRLMVGESAVQRVPLGPDELPVLDFVRIRPRQLLPRYGLVLALEGRGLEPAMDSLRSAVQERLSGPASDPVVQDWTEISVKKVNEVLADLDVLRGKDLTLTVRTITIPAPAEEAAAPALPAGVAGLGPRRAVARLALSPGDVPVLDEVQIAFDSRGA